MSKARTLADLTIPSGTPVGTTDTQTLTNKTFGNPTVVDVNSSSTALRVTQTGTGNALLVEDAANPDSTPFVITADGRAVIGATSAVAPTSGITPWLQLQGTTSATSSIGAMRFSNDAVQPYYVFAKSRSATNGTFGTVVQSGDALGTILFNGDDGSATPIQAASINAAVDGTPGTNDMPGRLVFSTTADGASSPTERMRIDSAGTVQLSADYKENVVTANTSTAYTISLAAGTVQILTLTGNCTYTFPTPVAGKSFILVQKQDGTGSRTVTWPASVDWPGATAPTLTATASKADKFVFTAIDGSNWLGSVAGQNYTV